MGLLRPFLIQQKSATSHMVVGTTRVTLDHSLAFEAPHEHTPSRNHTVTKPRRSEGCEASQRPAI